MLRIQNASVTNESTDLMCQASNQGLRQMNLRKFLVSYYPLLSIFIGFLLVSLSVGPYSNGDTLKEYDAVSGILKSGLPIINGGYLMDEPPVGFYIHALVFKLFGASVDNGLIIILLLSLGCIALIYAIGTDLYNKTTGFFATLLFAFTPWHLILSRSFLIDVPCLFFSLLSLFAGLLAFRKSSFWLLIVSGIAFAVAFNTKLYAVFVLIPLLAFFFHYQPKDIKHIVAWFVTFVIPVLVTTALWYEIITGIGLPAIYIHPDLYSQNPNIVAPNPLFAINFLTSYGVGWFFVDAIIVSLLVVLWQRRFFREYLFSDITCLAAVICVVGVNTILGAALDLKAPYYNAIKYDYQALPFLSFLAASLVTKSVSLLKLSRFSKRKAILVAVALFGFILVAAAIFYNMRFAHMLSSWDFLIFRVAPTIDEGYSLFNPNPTGASGLMMGLQFLGFAIAISGILWISRDKLGYLRNIKNKRKF